MMRYLKFWAISLLSILMSCCNNGGNSHREVYDKASTSSEKLTQLPLPPVPPEYDTPEKRVNYILNVYWNGLDFTDHSLSLDTAFMEQSFSNFIGLLSYEQNVAPPMRHLVQNVASDSLATIFLWDIADKYLNDPNSPMRNGELYRVFLKALGESPVLNAEYRDKLIYQVRIANLNRPGFIANDFHFETRDAERASLLSSSKGSVTLLIFYDPDCESCNQIMKELTAAALPVGLKVIAIDAEDDRNLWKATADSLPQDWIVGFASEDIQGKMLYHLPATPTIYLLDKDSKVILKDPSPQAAIETAASILESSCL